jgi:TolA-binding protein
MVELKQVDHGRWIVVTTHSITNPEPEESSGISEQAKRLGILIRDALTDMGLAPTVALPVAAELERKEASAEQLEKRISDLERELEEVQDVDAAGVSALEEMRAERDRLALTVQALEARKLDLELAAKNATFALRKVAEGLEPSSATFGKSEHVPDVVRAVGDFLTTAKGNGSNQLEQSAMAALAEMGAKFK